MIAEGKRVFVLEEIFTCFICFFIVSLENTMYGMVKELVLVGLKTHLLEQVGFIVFNVGLHESALTQIWNFFHKVNTFPESKNAIHLKQSRSHF